MLLMHFGYDKLLVVLGVTEAVFVGSAASSGSDHWFSILTFNTAEWNFLLLFVYKKICIVKHESTCLFLAGSDYLF